MWDGQVVDHNNSTYRKVGLPDTFPKQSKLQLKVSPVEGIASMSVNGEPFVTLFKSDDFKKHKFYPGVSNYYSNTSILINKKMKFSNKCGFNDKNVEPNTL